jgi:Protein of unknown function (DUF3168)
MARIEEALEARLTGFAGLVALVADRIYPVRLPQNPVYPAITYQRVSGVREHTMGSDPGIAAPRFQVSVWGTSVQDTIDVSAQVQAALSRFSGVVSGVTIQDIFLENELDVGYEATVQVYHRANDFIVWHRE